MMRFPRNGSWFVDAGFAILTYGLVLIIDPWMATTLCAPLVIAGTWMRRRFGASFPFSGGLVLLLNIPICVFALACVFAFGSLGLFLGAILAFSILLLTHRLQRKRHRPITRRRVFLFGGLFFVFTFGFTGVLLETGICAYPTEELIKVVSRAPDPPKWSDESKKQAVAAVFDALEGRGGEAGRNATWVLRREAAPFGVYVTLYDPFGYRSRGVAVQGKDTFQKVIRAAKAAMAQNPRKARRKKGKPGPWAVPAQDTRVQIDVAGAPRRMTKRPFFYLFRDWIRKADPSLARLEPLGELLNIAFQFECGIDGMRVHFDGESDSVLMLPADPVTYGWLTPRVRSAPGKVRQMIRRTWKREFGDTPELANEPFRVTKFRTESFGALGSKGSLVHWMRGNVFIPETLTRQKLVEGIILAADWLARQVEESSKFSYEKHPPHRNTTRSYNLPRHAGSVYGLFEIYRASKQFPEFRDAGIRALEAGLTALAFIGNHLGVPTHKGNTRHLGFLDEKGRTHSGSTALGALAVAKLPNANEVTDPHLRRQIEAVDKAGWLTGMGDCLLQMIDSEGAVFGSYKESQEMNRVVKEPLYYPGEVMLALTQVYCFSGEARFLEGARRIGDRQLRRYRWPLRLGFPLPGDHWIIQALSETAELTNQRKYAKLAVLMGNGYLREQHPPQVFLYPDYLGGYRRIADLPRTTRAASRGEALGSAVNAARFLNVDTTDFEKALVLGARHLLEQQFVDENAYFIPERFDVRGGIRMGLVDNHLRIDNNQHAIVALIQALEAMDELRAP